MDHFPSFSANKQQTLFEISPPSDHQSADIHRKPWSFIAFYISVAKERGRLFPMPPISRKIWIPPEKMSEWFSLWTRLTPAKSNLVHLKRMGFQVRFISGFPGEKDFQVNKRNLQLSGVFSTRSFFKKGFLRYELFISHKIHVYVYLPTHLP